MSVTTNSRAETQSLPEAFQAEVLVMRDYYPSGPCAPGRMETQPNAGTVPGQVYVGAEYRYGFQGQERVDEIRGGGMSYNYEFRIHDPRVGRFLSVDPPSPDYPWNSPYAFSENRVMDGIELEGLEAWKIKNKWDPNHIMGFRKFVSERAGQAYMTEKYTCEDFALMLLVSYASANGLPIKFENGSGIYDAADSKFKDPVDYGIALLSSTAARDFSNPNYGNTVRLSDDFSALKPGSLVLSFGDKNYAHHIGVVVCVSSCAIDGMQGNFDPAKWERYKSKNFLSGDFWSKDFNDPTAERYLGNVVRKFSYDFYDNIEITEDRVDGDNVRNRSIDETIRIENTKFYEFNFEKWNEN